MNMHETHLVSSDVTISGPTIDILRCPPAIILARVLGHDNNTGLGYDKNTGLGHDKNTGLGYDNNIG